MQASATACAPQRHKPPCRALRAPVVPPYMPRLHHTHHPREECIVRSDAGGQLAGESASVVGVPPLPDLTLEIIPPTLEVKLCVVPALGWDAVEQFRCSSVHAPWGGCIRPVGVLQHGAF